MIRAARRASLLVAFYLLTSTATAYTECAWELWHGEHIGSFETTPLMAMGAWSDRKDCEMVQEAKLKQLASDPYSSSMPRDPGIYDKIETLGNGVSVERYRKATGERFAIVVYRYLCLPDTVDPRGPKGK